MGESSIPTWVSSNWLSYHLAVVPIGTVATTTLLLFLVGSEWHWWSGGTDLLLSGQIAPFGAAVYGAAMFLAERIFRMFWALAQRKRDIEKGLQKGREEGREEGREQLEQELIRQANATGEVILGNVRLRVDPHRASGDLTAPETDDDTR